MANYTLTYTGAEVQAALDKANNMFNLIYPVGSIYISTNSTNPSVLFGVGTWEQVQGRFLLGQSSSYTAGSTGGEATHTLTESEMPKHWHNFQRQQWYSTDTVANSSTGVIYSWKSSTGGTTSAGYTLATSSGDGMKGTTGGSAAHNNMPPYLSVYIWKRTA